MTRIGSFLKTHNTEFKTYDKDLRTPTRFRSKPPRGRVSRPSRYHTETLTPKPSRNPRNQVSLSTKLDPELGTKPKPNQRNSTLNSSPNPKPQISSHQHINTLKTWNISHTTQKSKPNLWSLKPKLDPALYALDLTPTPQILHQKAETLSSKFEALIPKPDALNHTT